VSGRCCEKCGRSPACRIGDGPWLCDGCFGKRFADTAAAILRTSHDAAVEVAERWAAREEAVVEVVAAARWCCRSLARPTDDERRRLRMALAGYDAALSALRAAPTPAVEAKLGNEPPKPAAPPPPTSSLPQTTPTNGSAT
jgi:hypothetical protein